MQETFFDWLKTQSDGQVGMLAKEVRNDRDWPRYYNKYSELEDYLYEIDADDRYIKALRVAYKEYRKTHKTSKSTKSIAFANRSN